MRRADYQHLDCDGDARQAQPATHAFTHASHARTPTMAAHPQRSSPTTS